MADKPLTTDSIALTEKKMNMTLDDIIKMEKKSSRGQRPPRQPIKGPNARNGNKSQANAKAQQFVNSRSMIRQGVLAKRRSNFQNNQFPVTTENAKKAAVMPIRKRPAYWKKSRVPATLEEMKSARVSFGVKDKVISKQKPHTLDALFSNMKQQRMKVAPQQVTYGSGRRTVQRGGAPRHGGRRQERHRNGFSGGHLDRFGNFNRQ